MCIIVSKERGIDLPNRSILRNCFSNNPDGAGFMYNYKGEVVIQKGFMSWKDFDDALKKVEHLLKDIKKHAIVFHFRITTQGGTNPMNCHPFPISDTDFELKQTYIKTDVGVAHNGIISLTSKNKYSRYDSVKKAWVYDDVSLSDTQLFIRDYMFDIKKLNPDFYLNKSGLKVIDKLIDSKMTFLDKNGNVTYVGHFNSDKSGLLYSNYSYEASRVKYCSDYDGYGTYSSGYKTYNSDAKDYTNTTKTDEKKQDTKDVITSEVVVEELDILIMPIPDGSFWWNSHDNGDYIDGGNWGIDEYGYLYKTDKTTKECYLFTTKPVTIFSAVGYEIDFDVKKSDWYTDIEAKEKFGITITEQEEKE